MKRRYVILAALVFVVQIGVAQTSPAPSLKPGWERIYIKDVGSFDLPPTMEVQGAGHKIVRNSVDDVAEYDVPYFIAQQEGLNDSTKRGFEKYARVMFQTEVGVAGDYEKSNFRVDDISTAGVGKLNSFFRELTQQQFLQTQQGLPASKLIEWYPLTLEKINGLSCVHVSYKRQQQNGPVVLVHVYLFHNNDRLHTLTMSYKESETEYWKSDYTELLASFRISNIR